MDTDSVAVGMPGDKRRASVYSIDENSTSSNNSGAEAAAALITASSTAEEVAAAAVIEVLGAQYASPVVFEPTLNSSGGDD